MHPQNSTGTGTWSVGQADAACRQPAGARPPALAAAAATAAAAALDPVENISAQAAPRYRRGMYREQYRRAARNGIWGLDGAMCGASVLVREADGRLLVMPVLCDRWSCELCGPRRAAWLMRQINESRDRYHLDYFWTLTVWTETCTAEESTRLITKWWDNLGRRLRRKYGPFSFLWTLEHTKRDYAHLHLLTALDMPESELSTAWRDVSGGSWVVRVEPVASERASTYLAKYCTQQARKRTEPGYGHLRGRRFFSKSRDVQFDPFRAASGAVGPTMLDEETGEVVQLAAWSRLDVPYWEYIKRCKERGLDLAVAQVAGVPKAEFRLSEVSQ